MHYKNYIPVLILVLVVLILVGTSLLAINLSGRTIHLGGRQNALIVYPFIDLNGPYTYLSIINLASVPQNVTLTFRDKTGVALANSTNTIQSNSMMELSSGSGGGPGGSRGKSGYIIIEAADVYSLRVQAYIFYPSTASGFALAVSSTSISPYGSVSSTSIQQEPPAQPAPTAASASDTTPPNTTIVTKPPSTTRATSLSFTFRSSESGSTFECKLDDGQFESCTSAKRYRDLSRTSHTFRVRAKDAAGNLDPTPDEYTWTIT